MLVSVRTAAEAQDAIAGGADVIDAKDPLAGALGTVSPNTLLEIRTAVAGRRPLSAALGDASDEARIEAAARTFVAGGAAVVKVGFAGVTDPKRVRALLAATARGAAASDPSARVVAVAYADAVGCPSIDALTRAAAQARVEGLLIDTFDKDKPGLTTLVDGPTLKAWVDAAHDAGLFVALAGKLTAGDLDLVGRAGADIVGIRGAACDGGRRGRIRSDRVRALRARLVPAQSVS